MVASLEFGVLFLLALLLFLPFHAYLPGFVQVCGAVLTAHLALHGLRHFRLRKPPPASAPGHEHEPMH